MTKVMVAMSGGVDSSVAAALACENGDEVVGVTLYREADKVPQSTVETPLYLDLDHKQAMPPL